MIEMRDTQNLVIKQFDGTLCSKANKTSLIELEKRIYDEFLRRYDYDRIEIEFK